mgnify:CR=1 FL=1
MSPELNNFFSDEISVDTNTYELVTTEKYKEAGQLKTKTDKKTLHLVEVQNPVELITSNGNFEYIDYYPKSFFKKIFNIRNTKNMSFEGDENNFVLMSEKTSKIFKTNCKVYPLNEDDKVIIGQRSLLITNQSGEKLFAWCDKSNFKTLLIR